MNLKNFLLSGFDFESYDQQKYKYQLFNSLLGFNAILVFFVAIIRLLNGQFLHFVVDLAYCALGILIVVLTRKYKERLWNI